MWPSSAQETPALLLVFLSFGVRHPSPFVAPIRAVRHFTNRDRVGVHCVGVPLGLSIRWPSLVIRGGGSVAC